MRDEAGAPLAGVTVALAGTPLEPATSAANGSFAFASVAAGSYELTARLGGYVPFATDVTVVAGEETVVAVTLQRYEIAVTGDHQGALTRSLEAKGYRVEATTIAAIADRPGDYRVIVANGSQDDPGEEVFRRFLANADAAEVSVIFLDTWGISYGSLLHLSRYTGDPPTTGSGFNEGEISFVARSEHPLTAGLTVGERIEALARETEYAWFSGYGGRSVADVYVGEQGRTVGSAIGYEPRTLGSVHVLLSLHGASPWTGPTTGWTNAAARVFDNAIGYALDASFGAVAGTVTDASGAPLAASVTVAGTGESAVAAADGSYRLLLPAGSYTLRFERVGYTPKEVAVTIADGQTATVDAQLASSGLGAVTGVVRSAAGGAPVAGARVEVLGSGLPAATTGADGRYTVDGVPGGTYRVEVGATGFGTRVVENVVVADGAATELDVELAPALRAAVLGDHNGTITAFLNANEVTATATGWEAVDALGSYDLLILNNPTDPGEEAFKAHLAALDAAGKSAIFIEGALTSGGGVRLLRKYFGDPPARDFVSSDGDPFFEPTVSGHPLFAGLAGERIQVLAGDEWGAYFTGYSGIELARFGTNELGVLGSGAAYEPRTPTSVRLLLGALGASTLASPAAGWTEDGKRVFLNAVRWAAAPGLAAVAGRVTDAGGEPIAGATVRIAETGLSTQSGADGSYELPHPAGSYALEVSAFGYVARSLPVVLAANEVTQLDVALALADVGAVNGTITSAGDLSPQAEPGTPLVGATVRLVGHPRTATTAEDGSYTLANVEPGTYTLEVEAAGHVRFLVEGVVVTAGETTRRDVRLRSSPKVGVIDDCQQTEGCVDKMKGYLAEWGYLPEEIGWGDTERLAELDLVVANLGDFPRLDPGAAGLAAFQDAANRAHVPVIWLEQFQRGSIRHLRTYEGDPATVGEDRTSGTVEAEILAEHPLTAGFAVGERVPIVEANGEHTWFGGYSGTTVANLRTGSDGVRGSAIAYRGRTASSVDVLFSSFAASFYTWPPVGGEPAELLTPQAERLFHNALNYALDAPALAAEARGTVRSSAGGTIASTVKVLETGKTYAGRAGDGTFLVPLQPGTWTLEVSAFGHATEQRSVTVAAGDVRQVELTLASNERGSIAGRVTDDAGVPLEGVSLALEGTLLAASTGADGRYRLDDVPVGAYELVVRKAGYGLQRRPVTVSVGATTTVDVTLAVSRVVAVAGDFQNRITTFLTENGYAVVQWSWADVQQHVGELGDVGLVVLNGSGTQPTNAELTTFLDAAAAAGRSVIFAGQNGTGSIRTLRTATGDPVTVTHSFAQQQIYYRPTVEHPIFAGFPVGEPIELMRQPVRRHDEPAVRVLPRLQRDLARAARRSREGRRPRRRRRLPLHHADERPRAAGEPRRLELRRSGRAVERRGRADLPQRGRLGAGGGAGAGLRHRHVRRRAGGGRPRHRGRAGPEHDYGDGRHVPARRPERHTHDPGHRDWVRAVRAASSRSLEDARVQARRRADADRARRDRRHRRRRRLGRAALGGAGAPCGRRRRRGHDRCGRRVRLRRAAAGRVLARAAQDRLPAADVRRDGRGRRDDDARAGACRGTTSRCSATSTGCSSRSCASTRSPPRSGRGRIWPPRSVATTSSSSTAASPRPRRSRQSSSAADAAGTSLVFTGTWGVLNGGLRLLAQYRPDEVAIGGQGYRDGAVTLTGFDGAHPAVRRADRACDAARARLALQLPRALRRPVPGPSCGGGAGRRPRHLGRVRLPQRREPAPAPVGRRRERLRRPRLRLDGRGREAVPERDRVGARGRAGCPGGADARDHGGGCGGVRADLGDRHGRVPLHRDDPARRDAGGDRRARPRRDVHGLGAGARRGSERLHRGRPQLRRRIARVRARHRHARHDGSCPHLDTRRPQRVLRPVARGERHGERRARGRRLGDRERRRGVAHARRRLRRGRRPRRGREHAHGRRPRPGRQRDYGDAHGPVLRVRHGLAGGGCQRQRHAATRSCGSRTRRAHRCRSTRCSRSSSRRAGRWSSRSRCAGSRRTSATTRTSVGRPTAATRCGRRRSSRAGTSPSAARWSSAAALPHRPRSRGRACPRAPRRRGTCGVLAPTRPREPVAKPAAQRLPNR